MTAEPAEAIVAGPGVLADPVKEFGPSPDQRRQSRRRGRAQTGKARLAQALMKTSPGLVNFAPAGGVLKKDTPKAFSLMINTAGIASGMFQGAVSVSINNAAPLNFSHPVNLNL